MNDPDPTTMAEIGRLTGETAHWLDRVAEGVFDAAPTPGGCAAFLAAPNHVMMLARAEGRVIGMGSGAILLHPDKAPQFFINEIGVATDARRRGIGRALLAALNDWAGQNGCTVSWLGTEIDNEAANGLYRAYGAKDGGQFILYEMDLPGPAAAPHESRAEDA